MKAQIALYLMFSVLVGYAQSEIITINSVKDVQRYALEKNTQVLNGRLDQLAAKKRIWETTTLGLPRIAGNIDYNNQIDVPTQLIPAQAFEPDAPADLLVPVQFGVAQSLSAGLTLNQLIFDGSYFVGLRAAKAFSKLTEKQSKETEAKIRYEVTKAYYSYLTAKESHDLLKETLENTRKIFQETEATYKEGFIEELDRDRLKLTLNILEDQYNKVDREIGVSELLLKFQIGILLTDSIVINDSIANYIPDLLKEEEKTEVDYEKLVEYQSLLMGLDLQELEVKQFRSENYPSVYGFFTHSQNAFGNEFNFFGSDAQYFPTTIAGLKVTVPIFNSFGQRAKIMQSKYKVQKMLNQKQNMEQGIDLAFQKARSDYKSSKEQYVNQQENRALAKKIYDRTLLKQKEGVGSSLEVNDAQNKFLETQTSYVNTLLQLLINKVELDKSVGNYDF